MSESGMLVQTTSNSSAVGTLINSNNNFQNQHMIKDEEKSKTSDKYDHKLMQQSTSHVQQEIAPSTTYQQNTSQNNVSYACNSDSNANINSDGSTESSGATFTTLTTFRNHTSSTGDEYVPNGGNFVFGLPSSLLMTVNSGELNDENININANNINTNNGLIQSPQPFMANNVTPGLMPAPQSQSVYQTSNFHQPHFNIPPQFIPNLHSQSQSLPSHIGEPNQTLSNDLKKDKQHIIGNGNLIIASSSSATPPPTIGHHLHAQTVTGNQTYFPTVSTDTESICNQNVSNDLLYKSAGSTNMSNSAEDATDPYLCVWCTFKTIYKGNMKRHLLSCHGGITDELLRRLSFDVDRLRKLCPNRPHISELPIMPKAPRQASNNIGTTGDADASNVGNSDNINNKMNRSSKSNGAGSSVNGRKRSTNNNANGSSGTDNGNRGRPRKSAKANNNIKIEDASSTDKQENDEVSKQNDATSSSPSAASLPARFNSKTSASSSSESPSLLALSSSIAATSLMSPALNSMTANGHGVPPTVFSNYSLLQHTQPIIQFGAANGHMSQHQFSNPSPLSHAQSPLFMVMGGTGVPAQPVAFPEAPSLFHTSVSSTPNPLIIPQSQTQIPLSHHFQHIDAAGIPTQPIYISSGVNHYQPILQSALHLPPHLQSHHQQEQIQIQQQQLQQLHTRTQPNFAPLASFKPSYKDCNGDNDIIIHSYNNSNNNSSNNNSVDL